MKKTIPLLGLAALAALLVGVSSQYKASQILFTDGDTLQGKYDSGDIGPDNAVFINEVFAWNRASAIVDDDGDKVGFIEFRNDGFEGCVNDPGDVLVCLRRRMRADHHPGDSFEALDVAQFRHGSRLLFPGYEVALQWTDFGDERSEFFGVEPEEPGDVSAEHLSEFAFG